MLQAQRIGSGYLRNAIFYGLVGVLFAGFGIMQFRFLGLQAVFFLMIGLEIERDVAALQADLGKLEAEYHQATGEAKVELQKKVDLARGRLQAAQDKIQARIVASQNEAEAKIKSLQEQAARDSEERKAKREARIAELKADQKRRSDLLKQAWEKTKEALSI